VHVLKSPEEVDAAEIVREPLWNNLKQEYGPFDIIGDIHDCFDELADLLGQLGYSAELAVYAIRNGLVSARAISRRLRP
jgi:protein phosphatase